MPQDVGQVLAPVLAAAEEQRDAVSGRRRDDARRERSRSLGRIRGGVLFIGCRLFLGVHQFQDFDRRVVVVDDRPLRRLTDQLVRRGRQLRGRGRDDVPLRRGRQRNSQALLQLVLAMEGLAGPVLEQSHHAGDRGVVFLGAGNSSAPEP